jgi:hypothetical protein
VEKNEKILIGEKHRILENDENSFGERSAEDGALKRNIQIGQIGGQLIIRGIRSQLCEAVDPALLPEPVRYPVGTDPVNHEFVTECL